MEPLKKLKITCTSTDCENNLHCFLKLRKALKQSVNGSCRDCGAMLINWNRVHARDLSDVNHTFASMRFELIRHHFWHVPLSLRAVMYALKKGKPRLQEAVTKQLRRAIGGAHPYRDGSQTPREDSPRANAIHYAQHATASCCRKCLEEWHNIPPGRDLTDVELAYLTSLCMLYLEARIPELTDAPQSVRELRKTSSNEEKQQPLTTSNHAA